MDAEFERRRDWFEKDSKISRLRIYKLDRGQARFPCPCCGYPTIAMRGDYEICDICWWQDDGQDDPDADSVWGGPNGKFSLAAARENFKLYLDGHGPRKTDAIIEDTEVKRQAKSAVIAAYDAMVGTTDLAVLDVLWTRAKEGHETMSRELHRQIEEYEARLTIKGSD